MSKDMSQSGVTEWEKENSKDQKSDKVCSQKFSKYM